MADVMKSLRELEALSRKRYGADIEMSLAGHPVWGNERMVIIVRGKNHAKVAADLLKTGANEVVTEESFAWRGLPSYTYSVVSYPATNGS